MEGTAASPAARVRVAVLGAGNGGLAFAGYLASRGVSVHLYNRTSPAIARLGKPPQITLTGCAVRELPRSGGPAFRERAATNEEEELMPAASVPGPERWGSCHEARLEGFAGIAEWPNLTRAPVPRGYDDAEIPGIIGGNWLRFFEPFRDGGQ